MKLYVYVKSNSPSQSCTIVIKPINTVKAIRLYETHVPKMNSAKERR